MNKKNTEPSGDAREVVPIRVVDPAEKYYEQSRRNREAYKRALKPENRERSWSEDYPAERHHVLGQDGNAQSRSAFDFRTFRRKN